LLSCASDSPRPPMVRLKITKQPSGSIDGIQLDDFMVGFTYDVGSLLGCYLLAERLAVPVDDDSPALVMPLKTQVTFARRQTARRVLSNSYGAPAGFTQAADKPRRRQR
jgi:hypothetical protein